MMDEEEDRSGVAGIEGLALVKGMLAVMALCLVMCWASGVVARLFPEEPCHADCPM